jgi:hypothetical protein
MNKQVTMLVTFCNPPYLKGDIGGLSEIPGKFKNQRSKIEMTIQNAKLIS